jgi:outer membrane biosynthesis protein TonB
MADGEAKRSKGRPYWLPFVIAIVMWMALTYLFLYPEVVDNTRFTFSEWVTIGYLVTSVMLVWLFIWKITLNTEVTAEAVAAAAPAERPKAKAKVKVPEVEPEEAEEEAPSEPAPPKPRKKRVVVATGAAASLPHDDELPEDAVDEDIEAMEDLPRVVEYPKKEPGGVYSDSLMKVDDNLILNFRILLGKVCHNCEELEDCKSRVENKLDEDVFLYNFECKEGLKRELQAARKKREAEKEKAEAAKAKVEEKAAKAKAEEKAAKAKAEDGPEAAEGTGEEAERPKKKPPAKKKGTSTKKKPPAKKKGTSTKKKAPAKKKKTSTKSSKKGPAAEK